jgi:hypothetical protein
MRTKATRSDAIIGARRDALPGILGTGGGIGAAEEA